MRFFAFISPQARIDLMQKLQKFEKYFPILLVALAILLYARTLNNDFVVIDDYSGFVENETIRDMGTSLKSFNLNNILYAISYRYFGLSATPLHVMSISMHIINSILAYVVLKKLFNFKTAAIASLIFVVHPVNTEAVTWISGRVYLYLTLFNLAVLLPYIEYKKTNKLGYLFLAAEIYLGSLFIYRNIWLMLVPLLVFVVDRFFIEKKLNLKNLAPWGLIAGVAFCFLVISGPFIVEHTITQRVLRNDLQGKASNYGGNQEDLVPIIEGYPFSTYSMVKLFIFPKDLTFYYNGNPVEGVEYFSMFLVFIVYIAGIVWALKKDTKIAGTLILMLLLIAPVYSPIKVTWYIAERYLYLSSIFFGLFVAMAFQKIESKRIPKGILLTILGGILVGFSIKTYIRANEWQNTETISIANIKTAPYTERPYNDLGAYYLLNGKEVDSLVNYNKAITINRQSESAINTVGLIMLKYGPEFLKLQREVSTIPYEKDITENTGKIYFKLNEDLKALYFLNENLIHSPKDTETLNLMKEIYIRNSLNEFANELTN